jgi:hypothetical protein
MPTPEEAKAAVVAALSANAEEKDQPEVVAKEPTPEKGAEELVEAEEEEVETEQEHEPEPSKYIPIKRFNEVYGRMKELERSLVEVATNASRPQQHTKEVEEEFPDFEQMTPQQVAKWNLGQMKKMVQEAVHSEVSPITSNVARERATKMIDEAASKHSDFYDYKDQIIDIGNRHPTLTPEEAYFLATKDLNSVKKSMGKRMQEKIAVKKSARTETRTSPGDKTVEKTEFKNVKEAAIYNARKLGLM